ncbi:ketosteroid isomerase-like protein [Sphingomonas sp. UYAg733]
MLFAMLLAAAAPAPAVTAIDAERAFAAVAQTGGQWTAFRRYATDDAMMFVPQPIRAQEFLKDRKDPPKAINWWPTESYVSCDGSLAINTGGWSRPDGAVGYFSTVWVKQPDGNWKWIVDGGGGLEKPRPAPAQPKVVRAHCGKNLDRTITVARDAKASNGQSADDTLAWQWVVATDGRRLFEARLWNGKKFVTVIADNIAAARQ